MWHIRYIDGGKIGDGEDVKEWPETNEVAFLRILCKRVKKDPNGTLSFKQSDWQEMDDKVYLAIRKRYGIAKLKGKYNHFRHTGVTYDSNSNIIFAAEDVWHRFYKKHKNFKGYRKNGYKHYDLLGQVFSKSTTIEHLHHASTQLPLTSNEKCQTKEEFLNRGIHVSDGKKSSIGNSKGKQSADDYILVCNKVKKESKFEKLDSCLEMWASSLSARVERDLTKAQRYKSQSNEAKSVMSNPYSTEECMDMLEAMEGVSDVAYSKALQILSIKIGERCLF
ncbi:hypothetical protein P3X46_025939 [Hevea brasiliensis]|uniref:Myb/SANT-like domain-containing protein n=1 Tax=Hevea brasiliensis TaxID=3981 RepID=A0ABQ9KWP8_HEVBR|nr:hypothetical protein P3X46_025939 [Hevea brasiliensis]